MFNILQSISPLFVITLVSFICIFTLRLSFIHKGIFIILYHFFLLTLFFSLSVVGGSVQNDGYKRLETFIELEKQNKLDMSKYEHKDTMLRIDIQQFRNSQEFKKYLKDTDKAVDKAEALFIGWLIAFLAELSLVLSCIGRKVLCLFRFKFSKS